MSEKQSWMFITEWVSILGAFLTGFIFLHAQINTLDQKIERLTTQQAVRSDRLYEMFYELLKENKK